MIVMLCRNRVEDFEKWKAVFDSHLEAQDEAGLRFQTMWRDLDDPDNVFFLFEVLDIAKAKAFVESPESEEAGEVSGVIDGEIHFLASYTR
jgi:hypothetical protein